MPKRVKLPGVYMIRNKLNGKIYIGQSQDIAHRFDQYRWGATTNAKYVNKQPPIVWAMRQDGIENFEFTIIDSGPQYKSTYMRTSKEIEMIYRYRSNDPAFGYNESRGGEPGSPTPHKQTFLERANRAKALFLYDTKTGSIMLYFGGAKAIGKDFGYTEDKQFGKDVMSHTVNRGSLLNNRYYLIPANREDRLNLLEKLRDKKVDNPEINKQFATLAARAFREYEKAVMVVDESAQTDFGMH